MSQATWAWAGQALQAGQIRLRLAWVLACAFVQGRPATQRELARCWLRHGSRGCVCVAGNQPVCQRGLHPRHTKRDRECRACACAGHALAPRDAAAVAAAAAAAVAAAVARPPPNPLAGLPGAGLLRTLRLADDALAQGRHADAVLVYRGVRPWPEARALTLRSL